MSDLNQEIKKAIGVSPEEAFRIDEVNIFERLGKDTLIKLSTEFYRRVFNDEEEPWFKNIFKGRSKEDAIQNQVDFFVQRMGGPPLYSQRKGHPALMARHIKFNMTQKAARRWLHHMEASIGATKQIDDDSKERMLAFFKHTAFFLAIGMSRRR